MVRRHWIVKRDGAQVAVGPRAVCVARCQLLMVYGDLVLGFRFNMMLEVVKQYLALARPFVALFEMQVSASDRRVRRIVRWQAIHTGNQWTVIFSRQFSSESFHKLVIPSALAHPWSTV